MPDLVSKLREVIAKWRGIANLRAPYSDTQMAFKACADELESLLGREGQAATSYVHYANPCEREDCRAMREELDELCAEKLATSASPSTPIVPGTPADPRFDSVVEELAEEFAILDGDIPALMFIVGKLRQSVLEEAAQFIDDHYSDVDHPFAGDAFREKYAIAEKRSS